MKVDLRRDGKLIPTEHSAQCSQSGKNKLSDQPRRGHAGNLRQQANQKYQRGPRSSERKLRDSGDSHESPDIARTNLVDTQPTSKSNASHGHGDEDCELMVNVAVDSLECQQQENLESHQREPGGRHAEGRSGAGTSLLNWHVRQQDRHKQQYDKCPIDDASETEMTPSPEPAGVAGMELRAPQRNVEVIGDRLEIAVDWRRGLRL